MYIKICSNRVLADSIQLITMVDFEIVSKKLFIP